MSRLSVLTQLTEVATAALELKKRQVRPHLRRAISRELNIRQAEAAERDVERALVPVFRRQVARMVSKLGSGGKDVDDLFTKGDLPGHEFRGNQWTEGGGSSGGDVDTNVESHAANFINVWTYGKGGVSAGADKELLKPSDDVIKYLSDFRPKDEVVTLFRSHILRTGAGSYESWTTERGLADVITENNEGRVTLSRKVHRSEILFSADHLPDTIRGNALDSEVVVANGRSAYKMAQMRGEKLVRGQASHGEIAKSFSSTKGDLPGHEFHGNQWTNGGGGGSGGEGKVRQIDTSEFKKWFGDSKVVGENGEPLMVHHGSQNPGFDTFNIGETETGEGVFFTDNVFVAEDYAKGTMDLDEDVTGKIHDSAGIYSCYLKIVNPKVIDANGQQWFNLPMKTWLTDAKSAGHDGVVIRNVRDAKFSKDMESTEYVVFSSAQIKSATGNSGTFDPNLPIDKSFSFIKSPSRIDRIFNKKHATKELINAIAPILAVRMAEAARNQLLALGVDMRRRRKSIKGDLPGHEFHGNQWTNGGGSFSEGKTRQIDTPEFKKWFGDSKVVDEKGEPLVVYHGTKQDFDQFNPASQGTGIVGMGFYFDRRTDIPNRYAGEGEGSRVIPVYLSIKRPAEVSDQMDVESAYSKKNPGYKDLPFPDRQKLIQSALIESGFDGAHWEGIWVAFSPTQIKSATGNRGTFDPDDPDITKSVKGDLPGHPFRGNQWTDGGGNGGGGGLEVGRVASIQDIHSEISGVQVERVVLTTVDGVVVGQSAGDAISADRVPGHPEYNVLGSHLIEHHNHPGDPNTLPSRNDVISLGKSPGLDAVVIHSSGNEVHEVRIVDGKDRDEFYRAANDAYARSHSIELDKLIENPPAAEDRDSYKNEMRLRESASAIAELVSQNWITFTTHIAGQKSFSSTKTTMATDWLMEQEGGDLDALIEGLSRMFPDGTPFRLMTELPKPMQERIVKELRESFSQDYWAEIAETTAGDANRILERGLQEGWSIRDMAKEIKESLGEEYYKNRSWNIARTEAGNCLNGSRKAVMDQLQEDLGDKVPMRPVWLSVLGNTTRDSHAELDGVPADANGMWDLAGYEVPWPGHVSLPVGERANCRCSLYTEFGLRDDEAAGLIEDYYARQEEEEASVRGLVEKGDLPGHEFRGNQWTNGGLVQSTADAGELGEDVARVATKLSGMYVDPSDKKAFARSKKDMTKAYNDGDADVRDVADVLAAFTQGSFKEVRQVAQEQAQGTFGQTVQSDRDRRSNTYQEELGKGKEPSGYSTADGSWLGQPLGSVKTLGGEELISMTSAKVNEAVAKVQDAIAGSPIYAQEVHRGMSWPLTKDAAERQYADGNFDRIMRPGETLSPGWTTEVNKYGDEVTRPPKSELSKLHPFDVQEGQILDIPGPTSFTRSRDAAEKFAYGKDTGQGGRGKVAGARMVVTVQGGVKGVHADMVSPWKKQQEFVTQGQFKVLSVTQKTEIEDRGRYEAKVMVTHVVVEQVAVYKGNLASIPQAPSHLTADAPVRYESLK